MAREKQAQRTRDAVARARIRLARADDQADDERAAERGDRSARARLQLARGDYETFNQWAARNYWSPRDAWRALYAGTLVPERRCPDGALDVVEHDAEEPKS